MASTDQNGLVGGLSETPDSIVSVVIAFLSLSFAYSIELNLQVWLTFTRYAGLYFWSLLAASLGIFLNSLGYLLKFFELVPSPLICLAISNVGWWGMVTGQSLVLYSRLHLVLSDQRRLKMVLGMIIADAIILHPTTTIVHFLSNAIPIDRYIRATSIVEKFQVTTFCLQECILSTLYIWEVRKLMQRRCVAQQKRMRSVLRELIYINVIVIALDLVVVSVEYANLYEIQISLKNVVYALKLRLEYAILNRLVEILESRCDSLSEEHRYSFSQSGQAQGTEIPLNNSSYGKYSGGAKAYEVFASRASKRASREVDDGVIHAKTEVKIRQRQFDEPSLHEEELESRPSEAFSKRKQTRDGASVSSAEIELARAGG